VNFEKKLCSADYHFELRQLDLRSIALTGNVARSNRLPGGCCVVPLP
jgi:hypothetical protein